MTRITLWTVSREITALGWRRAPGFGFYRIRRALDRLWRSRSKATLTAQQWHRGVSVLTSDAAARLFRQGVASMEWAGANDQERVVRYLEENFAEHVRGITAAAERLLEGWVTLFSNHLRIFHSDREIDWQRDWLGNHRWSAEQRSRDIPVGRQRGADPRVAWELGRCLHLVTLAQAYALTAEAAYADEVVRQVNSFIDRNPVGYGIQWASTMDVAIRACNWLAAWDLVRGAPSAAFLAEKLLRSLIEHGRFVMSHLDNLGGTTSNHYLADLAGLACLGRLAPIWPEAAKWAAFWKREIAREISKQVLADGFTFEASVSYHRLALELLAYPAIPYARSDLPAVFWERLSRMFEATRTYVSRRGVAPQFGDNDGGRLHSLHIRGPLDHSYMLSVRRVLPGRGGGPETPESVWLFGPMPSVEPSPQPEPVALLPFGGIGVIRDGEDELFFLCGPNGQNGRGGHAHNDKLSFVFFVDGAEVVVDPGTYVYTRDLAIRQQFRSTEYHSTWAIAGAEQNRFSLISGFRLVPDAEPVDVRLREPGGGLAVLAGGHSGYTRRGIGLFHQRRIAHKRGSRRWVVLDVIRRVRYRMSAVPTSFVFTLPLAPDVVLETLEPGRWVIRTVVGTRVLGTALFRGLAGEWKVQEGWVSSNYATKRRTLFLRFHGVLKPAAHLHALRTILDVSRSRVF